jgi:hypothetical protein
MKVWSGAPVFIKKSMLPDGRGICVEVGSPHKALSWPEWIEVLECYLEMLREEHAGEIQAFKQLEESGKLVRLGNKPREKS